MRIVLQRVKRASVTIDGALRARIEKGMLILLGVGEGDTEAEADFLAQKCAALRIFPDREGAMNLSVVEAGGAALVVSQCTLYGDCAKGRRPSYSHAAGPQTGKRLYDYFVDTLGRFVPKVETGVFGAMMDVELVNDGPVTLILEK